MNALMFRLNCLICIVFFSATVPAFADDWPQWRGPNRDGVWSGGNLIDEFENEALELTWRSPIGSGYSGPTVADGRVYVMDRIVEPQQVERVLCFDARSGDPLWEHEYACPYVGIGYKAGPRASVTVDGEAAFALGAMGHLHCLDARTGDTRWKRDLNVEYEIQTEDKGSTRMPIWGIAASPLVHDDVLILHVGGRNGACVVGLEKSTGKELWRALDDRAQYSSPILIHQGNRPVVVVWTGDSISGLDPTSGQVFWRQEFTPTRMPIGISTPIVQGNRLFVTSFYDGAMMLELDPKKPAAKKLWHLRGRNEKDTKAIHSIISTPIWIDDHIYGVDSYGELRCIEAETGERIWETTAATPKVRWGTIHFVRNGDRVWMQNELGDLIISRLSPQGYEEIDRASFLSPTLEQLRRRDGVCWSHPAFANGFVFSRNDNEIICAKLLRD